MKNIFEVAKYKGKWAVFGIPSRTFTDIGKGKKNCIRIADELNKTWYETENKKGKKK